MKARPHSHPCAHCQTPVECGGELEQNHDGWPEVICYGYHVQGQEVLCAACAGQEAEERS